ncbi:MAG: oligosaccharide flippase family protein [Clostridia bacterium]|nr:oligosaccharide flippase family protein [Clostridia bacterium]
MGAIKKLKSRVLSKNLNLPARASLFFTASNLVAKGAAFLLTPLFTRILSPTEYGEYSLFGSYLTISIVIVSLELPGGVIMRAFQKKKELGNLTLISAFLLCAPLSLPTTLTLLSLKSGGGMTFPFAYLFLFVSLISLTVINLYVSKCKFLYKWIPYLIISVIQSVAAPVISILLISLNYFGELGHVSTKIGTVSAILFSLAFVLTAITIKKAVEEVKALSMSHREIWEHVRSSVKFLLKLSLPLLPYYFAVMLISQSDKMLISRFLGKGELGKYSVAYSAGIALTAITGGIMSSLSPWLMRKARAGDFEKIKETLNTVVSLSVVFIVLFLSVAPDVFTFLAPMEYSSALPVMFIISLIPIPLSLSQCASSIAIAEERVRGILLSGIIPALTVLAFGILLIPRGNLYLPAIITASGYFILMALGIRNVKLITGKYMINVNKTFQKLVFLIFFSALIYTLKDYMALRFAIISIFSLLLLYMLKETAELLKEK